MFFLFIEDSPDDRTVRISESEAELWSTVLLRAREFAYLYMTPMCKRRSGLVLYIYCDRACGWETELMFTVFLEFTSFSLDVTLQMAGIFHKIRTI